MSKARQLADLGGDTANLEDISSAYNAGALSNRNKIINGAMVIDQRNAGAAVTFDGSSGYSLDRFFSVEIGDGAFSVQQVSDAPTGFNNSLKVTVTTAQTGTLNASTLQSIEGFNTADLGWGASAAQSVTLSFWAKSSLTGTFGGAIRNSGGSRSYPFAYSITAANTWEYKTVSITGDTTGTWLKTNGVGISVLFSHGTGLTGAAGAWSGSDLRGATGQVNLITALNATWQITGVQLEAGDTATPFEHRSYGQELALCQRYYQQVLPTIALYMADYGGVARGYTVFPVQMRAAPTLTFIGQTFSYANATQTAALYSEVSPAYIPQIKMNAEL